MDIKALIEKQADCKVTDLQWWGKVRWEGGRLYYESTKILNEIAGYDIDNQILYLELLSAKKIRIYDNAPSEAPEITSQFYNWLNTLIVKLKIQSLEKTDRISVNSFENKDFFLEIFINGIHELQQQGDKASCIGNIKNNILKEEPFQYYFKTYFTPIYISVEPEAPKGNGRIDLKVKDKTIGIRIIEFKGWWNNSKDKIVEQVCDYLTDFETEGYIFIINHNKTKRILNKYKSIITSNEMNYIAESWKKIVYKDSSFEYFLSLHRSREKDKTIYHFIYDVY